MTQVAIGQLPCASNIGGGGIICMQRGGIRVRRKCEDMRTSILQQKFAESRQADIYKAKSYICLNYMQCRKDC